MQEKEALTTMDRSSSSNSRYLIGCLLVNCCVLLIITNILTKMVVKKFPINLNVFLEHQVVRCSRT